MLPGVIISQSETQLPKQLRGDRVRLTQVVTHLCANALKFTPRGHIVILASFAELDSKLSVAIIDNGTGLKREQKSHLLKRLAMLEKSAGQAPEGPGKSLAICRQLLLANGGEISLDSEGENRGCAVKFTMQMALEG